MLPWTKWRIDSLTVSASTATMRTPLPLRTSSRPFALSARTASRMTVRETPNWFPSSRSGGSASPGLSCPEAIISRMASVTLSDRRASRSIAWKTAAGCSLSGSVAMDLT